MQSNAMLERSLSDARHGARIVRKRSGKFWFTGSRAWSLLVIVLVVIAFLSATSENKYPGALVGASAFFLVQCILPACRPDSKRLLCPWNWALFVFFLQLVLLPLSVLLFGPSRGVLPVLPSDRAINLAMVINVTAFIAFCVTYNYFSRRRVVGQLACPISHKRQLTLRSPSLAYIALNGAIGVVGFFLAFGSFNKIAEYFSDPSGYH